jgi:hypothetical protein
MVSTFFYKPHIAGECKLNASSCKTGVKLVYARFCRMEKKMFFTAIAIKVYGKYITLTDLIKSDNKTQKNPSSVADY